MMFFKYFFVIFCWKSFNFRNLFEFKRRIGHSVWKMMTKFGAKKGRRKIFNFCGHDRKGGRSAKKNQVLFNAVKP